MEKVIIWCVIIFNVLFFVGRKILKLPIKMSKRGNCIYFLALTFVILVSNYVVSNIEFKEVHIDIADSRSLASEPQTEDLETNIEPQENSTNELKAESKKIEEKIPDESIEDEQKSIIEKKVESSVSKIDDGLIKYKKSFDRNNLTKGERIYVSGKIDAFETDEKNMLFILNGTTYIVDSNGGVGIYLRDFLEEEGGLAPGTYMGFAGRFLNYWMDSAGNKCIVFDEGWFTPAYIGDGEFEYVEIPAYNGNDIYSYNVEW